MKLILIISFFSINILYGTSQIDELKVAEKKSDNQIKKILSDNDSFSKSLYVNPFIGTGGHGHTYPGASAPFGMIQLSPDTRHEGWDGCSGYHYSDSIIYGFSHTHLSGTGIPDYGDLLIIPQNKKAKINPGYIQKNGYGDIFYHKSEYASPGFYRVHLENGNIDVRLTVSDRCGFHEYKFNKSQGKKFILIDLDHRDKLIDSKINIIDKQTLSGYRISQDWAEEQHFYFYLKTNVEYEKAHIYKKNGKNKLLLTFPKESNTIKVKVGISSVDEIGAKSNLESEINHWNFNKTRAEVTKKWNEELNKIDFYSSDKEIMTNFYTSLYHSFLAPNIFNDTDRRYRGRDNKIHKLKENESNNYTVFSLWDTYRATHPLYTITQVNRTNDFINVFLRQYEQGGDLPVWELAANETECMIGYHSVSVIADAYSKGIKDYDVNKAVEAMNSTAKTNEYGKKEFRENGYINSGEEPESVSKNLEYSYDDYCIGIMLENKKFKKENTAFNFVNSFDPNTKFMRARRSGKWFHPFNPSEVNFNYTEANSWQYSLYAPHAIGVLRDLLGGKDSLELWLDKLFLSKSKLSGRHQVDITGLIGQYAHGNEPSHHISYLYNYTNAPEKCQYYVDRILKEMYSNEPDGLSGNEDCGQMSSWYVLSALGIYQVAPGNPYYDIGRPLMDKAKINMENGKSLLISVLNNNNNNKYIQKISYNGKELNRHYIKHEELIAGGILEFKMGNSPQLNRKKFPHAPTISKLPENFVPVPFFNQTKHNFKDTITVSIDAIKNGPTQLYYTLDGTKPNNRSLLYKNPIKLNESTTIKAIAYNNKGKSSIISNTFLKKDPEINLILKSKYANQYSASGPETLIDKIRGNNEYRTGDWQGFWDQNLIAEINFEKPRKIDTIGIGFISDIKSWIFFPSEIEFSVSYDGKKFHRLQTIKTKKQTKQDMYPHHKDFKVKINQSKRIQKIRVIAKNYGKCPPWHLGNGNDTWLFADEIFFN
ncbi:MAG: glycosyl hydrolase family 92 [Crocinitomicaceae bacterium]|nr:glycosyl hydrolase family 92 [Crocinitomicaceae bacterium]|tara:strand:+ start:19903 stop:22875 length:2973 start_codon:yes stop_codon:yes gene_type:complete